jgi:hypothetical protein
MFVRSRYYFSQALVILEFETLKIKYQEIFLNRYDLPLSTKLINSEGTFYSLLAGISSFYIPNEYIYFSQ